MSFLLLLTIFLSVIPEYLSRGSTGKGKVVDSLLRNQGVTDTERTVRKELRFLHAQE